MESEYEVVAVLRDCRTLKIPLIFRAGGTSLSGQSLSDSVLVQPVSIDTGRLIKDRRAQNSPQGVPVLKLQELPVSGESCLLQTASKVVNAMGIKGSSLSSRWLPDRT